MHGFGFQVCGLSDFYIFRFSDVQMCGSSGFRAFVFWCVVSLGVGFGFWFLVLGLAGWVLGV